MDTKKIKMLLKEKEISSYKLAQMVGVANSHITNILNNKIKDPRFNLVCKIADVLGIKVDDLRKEYEENMAKVYKKAD